MHKIVALLLPTIFSTVLNEEWHNSLQLTAGLSFATCPKRESKASFPEFSQLARIETNVMIWLFIGSGFTEYICGRTRDKE